jgi:hypothetical protein
MKVNADVCIHTVVAILFNMFVLFLKLGIPRNLRVQFIWGAVDVHTKLRKVLNRGNLGVRLLTGDH